MTKSEMGEKLMDLIESVSKGEAKKISYEGVEISLSVYRVGDIIRVDIKEEKR